MSVFRYFVRTYPWQSFAVLLCLLLAALTEGVGVSTLLPLLSIATRSQGGAEESSAPSAYEIWVRDALERAGIEPALGSLVVLIAAAFWLKGLLLLLSNRRVGYTVAQIATDLRLGLLRALLATRWSFYTRQPIGAAANAMATEADRASIAFRHLALIATYGVEAALYTGIALAVSWRATLAAALAGLLTVSMLHALVRVSSRAGRKQTHLLKALLGRLTDALQAVKLLKATGRESSIGPLLAEYTRRLNRQLQRRVLAQEAMRALQEPMLVSLMCAGLFVAVASFDMALSSVGVLGLVFFRMLTRINSMQSKYQSMVAEASALWSIVDLIERAKAKREDTGGSERPRLARAVELRDVCISYHGQKVLDRLCLELPAGRITALVGLSGAGKTTVVDLITGLVEPESGEVRVDGIPLREIDLRAWRRAIGYVPQETILLNDSIRTNVTFGDPELTDAQIEKALRDADLWDFAAGLPEGIDSSVGERGALLSGGQRQRVAIARALVHEPRLLVLDEATAALDAASESEIWASIEQLRGRTTVVAISHQPALVAIADRVYRLENGRAIEAAPTAQPAPAGQEVA